VSFLAEAAMPVLSAVLNAAETTTGVVGPLTEMTQRAASVVWDTAAANIPRDLKWPAILLTLSIGTLIFLLRKGHGARNADGQERKTFLFNVPAPTDIYTVCPTLSRSNG
jgi:hypothetical protein